MDDTTKSKQQLIDELNVLRGRIAETEAARAEDSLLGSSPSGKGISRLLEEQKALAEIGRIINSSLNIDDVYELFARETRKLIDFDITSISLLNGGDEFVVAYTSELIVPSRQLGEVIAMAGSGTGFTLERNEVTVINMDHEKTLRSKIPGLVPPYLAGIRTFMGVPLSHKGESIGALLFTSLDHNAFDKEDAQLAERVSAQIAGAIANSRLYDDLRRAEASLRSNEKRLRSMVNAIPSPVLITRISDGEILFANKHMEELVGLPPEELIGRLGTAFYDNVGDRENLMRELEDRGYLQNREVPGKKFDGTDFWVNISAQPIMFDGEKALFTGFHDITARKLAEDALRGSEAKNRALVNAVPDLIFHIGRDGTFLDYVPGEGIELLMPPEEFLGKTIRDVMPDEFASQVMACIENTLSTGKMQSFEYQLPTASFKGEMHDYEARIVVSGEDGVLGIIRDVTERNQLVEQLHQAQKMEAVGQLAGGIAHDFNNLLSVIMSYTHLCIASLAHDSRLTGYLSEVQKSSERAANLTSQLLAFSRRQMTEPRPVNLNELVLDLEKMLRRLISEDIELNLDLDADLGEIKADPNQMEQVMVNLVVNARDAMLSGGAITIKTANVYKSDQAMPGEDDDQGYAMLTVSDTGAGIPEDVMPHIFEPFFTTKELGKGTGLGLSTCYGIVAQNGGHIEVENDEGRGARFNVYLPRVNERSQPLPLRDDSGCLPVGGETILIVEDDYQVRAVVAHLLREQGYTVLEASNGREALDISTRHEGVDIHLLLTDVIMPQMNGKQLVESLKKTHSETIVLYTSGYSDEDFFQPGELTSGIQFIQKPFKPSTLIRRVREILDNKQSMRSA